MAATTLKSAPSSFCSTKNSASLVSFIAHKPSVD